MNKTEKVCPTHGIILATVKTIQPCGHETYSEDLPVFCPYCGIKLETKEADGFKKGEEV